MNYVGLIDSAAYQSGVSFAAEKLGSAQRILILAHISPDGDTIGSAFALCRALIKAGKKARVECSDELSSKYSYIFDGVMKEDFEPDMVVSTDIAARSLLGFKLGSFKDAIELCIDHHPSNELYARHALLSPNAAATCEIIADVVAKLNVEIDKDIANCIYTGLSTDTGCFRFSNTTAHSLRLAALMIDRGAESAFINKRMFDTVSKERLMIEAQALSALEYYFVGKAALISVTHEMIRQSGVKDSDIEGLSAIPARIKGVVAGITVKEKEIGVYKISMRTNEGLNASNICAAFGGGGHAAAAGCIIEGSLDEVKSKILSSVEQALNNTL